MCIHVIAGTLGHPPKRGGVPLGGVVPDNLDSCRVSYFHGGVWIRFGGAVAGCCTKGREGENEEPVSGTPWGVDGGHGRHPSAPRGAGAIPPVSPAVVAAPPTTPYRPVPIESAKLHETPNTEPTDLNPSLPSTTPGMRARAHPTLAPLLITAATLAPAPTPLLAQDGYDIVLSGGRVMDPETGFDAVRNVGIRAGEIAAISEDPLSGTIVLHVAGLVVAPGFIDLHAHGQTNQANEFQARDGVTTALELESGAALPAAYLARRGKGAILNYGATVSHMSVRPKAMPARADAVREALALTASDPERALRELASVGSAARYDPVLPEDYGALRAALADGLAAGALGIGMAHQYYPGANHEEILEVFRFAADEGATIHTHVREMSIAAMQEVLANAVATGAPLHIVHVNSSSLWRIGPILDLIGGIRSRGFDVTTEAYPYTAASTGLQSALFDPGWKESLRIGYGDLQWQDTGERLTAETFQRYRAEGGTVIIHMMKDEWIREALSRDFVMVASDGMRYAPGAHPRSAGTFSRFLGRYVRDEGLMPLMEGLARITIMPARRLERMTDQAGRKGRLQAGMDADVTVFDPARIIDTATFEDDLSHSVGVVHVLVGGEFVVRNGRNVPGATPGRALVGRGRSG